MWPGTVQFKASRRNVPAANCVSCSFNPICMTWIKVEIFNSLIIILLPIMQRKRVGKQQQNGGKYFSGHIF